MTVDPLNDTSRDDIGRQGLRASQPPSSMTVEEALALVDKMNDASKVRILDTFRQIAAGFPDGHSAFIRAVNDEVARLDMDLKIMLAADAGRQ